MTQWGLDTLFNPAKRHMDEEKRRLQSTREEVGDASGGKRIDFEAGKVHIHRADGVDAVHAPEVDEITDATETTGTTDDADTDAAAAKKQSRIRRGDRDGDGKPSAAAIRAAKRRGRTA